MPKDIQTKTLRNQSKAYDMEDQLKAEYSITLLGKKYPLLTKTMKGFTSKASKSGKTRFNKLFNAPESVKREYIKMVNTALNMHNSTAPATVGDDMSNENVSTKAPQKQEKDITLKSDLSYDDAPESVAVFNEDKKIERQDEEPELETSTTERQMAAVAEKQAEKRKETREAILELSKEEPMEEEKPKRKRRTKKQMKEARGMGMEDVDVGKKTKITDYFEKGGKLKEPNNPGLKKLPKKVRNKMGYKMEGGMLEGKSHNEGGIPIEAEGGEFIVNKESTKHFEPQLEKMNDMGNELRDAKQPQMRRRKLNKINQMKRKMRKGGMLKYREGGKISEIEQPVGGRGLVGKLSKDDGKPDKGMYQELINKYFTKMDFTQTMRYVKNKNKDVENMGADALRNKAEDIAEQTKTRVKYNGNVMSQLKEQVYELMAIRLALQQQPKKQQQQGNIGLVVDMESVFGDGSEVDKQAFVKKYMRGGRIDKEQVRQDMGKPEDLENIVAQGKAGEMTQPKPDQKRAFQDFESLSAGGQTEGAISRGETSYTRRTFNLPMALNGSVEMDFRHRYAQEIDQTNEQYQKPQSLFRYRKKNNKKGRRNLLN